MIFSFDKIYDHKIPVTKCTIFADRKTRKVSLIRHIKRSP